MTSKNVTDHTPSQSSKIEERLLIRSLGDVISSCDKLSFSEHAMLSASLDSSAGSESVRHNNASWVASFHEKVISKTPGKYGSGTPTHRQLNFSTPRPKEPDRPSPTVSSVFSSDRWCLESMTPGMRYTPPNMAVRGMRMLANREAIGAYRINESNRKENERGASMCILPTPMLGGYYDAPRLEHSPIFMPSKPSPVISAFASPTETSVLPSVVPTPTPLGPNMKKHRAGFNSKHFPIPRNSPRNENRPSSLDN